MARLSHTLYLRCDLSNEIGMGHFRRMQILASCVEDPKFVISQGGEKLAYEMGIVSKDVVVVSGSVDDPWVQHIDPCSWIITDICYAGHKFKAESEIMSLAQTHTRVCVIDSMPPDHFAPNFHSDMLKPAIVVTPYLNAQNLRPPPPSRKWHSGGQFAVLDQTYDEEIQKQTQGSGVLIACGGSDPTDLSLRCAKALTLFQGKTTVVIGPLFSRALAQKLNAWAQGHANRHVTLAPKTLAPLIASHGLAIGRPGLIRYEAAALGRTSIFLSETDGYQDYFKSFIKSGLAEIYFANDPEDRDRFYARLRQIAGLDLNDPIFEPNANGKERVPLGGRARILKLLAAADRTYL